MIDQQKLQSLGNNLIGELFFDNLHKTIYATDASVYRKIPLAVAYPKNVADIQQLIAFATQNNTTLIPDDNFIRQGGKPTLQIIEGKYCTDHNAETIIDRIHSIYTPLKQAIQEHGAWPYEVTIHPVVISRTGTFHERTIETIHGLFTLKDKPPDDGKYATSPEATTLIKEMHVHAVQWLHLILSVARAKLKPSTTPQSPPPAK